MRLGIVDVGTNSIHLLIGMLELNGEFRVILKERDLTRLGEGGLSRGTLRPSAMRRALAVLRRYAETTRRLRVDRIEAVATSAVRDAENGREFIRRVRARTGLPLRIISGKEEATLIYLGVLQAHRLRRSALIVTIGGGSAQVILGDGAHLHYAVSVPLGGARMAQRFIRHDPARPSDVQALRQHVDRVWAKVGRAVRRHRWHQALGSSAMIQQVMLAAYSRTHRRPPAGEQGLRLSRSVLQRLVEWLARSTTAQRVQLPGVDPRREDLLLATAVTLRSWMEQFGVPMLRYASGSLREGLVVELDSVRKVVG